MARPRPGRASQARLPAALIFCILFAVSGCARPREAPALAALRAQARARLEAAAAYHVLIEQYAPSQGRQRRIGRIELLRDPEGRTVRALETEHLAGPGGGVMVADDEGFRLYLPAARTVWVGAAPVQDLVRFFPPPPAAGRSLAEALDALLYGWLTDPAWTVAGEGRAGRRRAFVLERARSAPAESLEGSLRLWVDAATGLPLRLEGGYGASGMALEVERLDLAPDAFRSVIAAAIPEGAAVIETEQVAAEDLGTAAALLGRSLLAPPRDAGAEVPGVRVVRGLPGGAFLVQARLSVPGGDVRFGQEGVPALPGAEGASTVMLTVVQPHGSDVEPVQVRGVKGRLSRRPDTVTLAWIQDGVLVSLEGDLPEPALRALAERLEWVAPGGH